MESAGDKRVSATGDQQADDDRLVQLHAVGVQRVACPTSVPNRRPWGGGADRRKFGY